MVRRLGHRRALDGIRAVAIVGVMGVHSLNHLFAGGAFGVDIFFVLSAFLITSLIVEEVEDRQGRYDFVSFYARRALRLGPALILWLALVAAPTAVAIHESSTIALSSVASLFYFGDFAIAAGARIGTAYIHVWSLAVEEQFYAVWPAALVPMVTRVRGLLRPALVAFAAASVAVTFVGPHISSQSYFLPIDHLIPIALGALAAHLFLYGVPAGIAGLARRGTTGLACIAMLAFVFFGYTPLSHVLADTGLHPLAVWIGIQLLTSLATALLALHLCIAERSGAAAVMSAAVLVWLGRRSYGLYLYHRTLTVLIPALFAGITVGYAAPIGVALSLLLAEASFRLVERPVNRAGRRWLRRHDRRGVREAESDLPIASTERGDPGSRLVSAVSPEPEPRG